MRANQMAVREPKRNGHEGAERIIRAGLSRDSDAVHYVAQGLVLGESGGAVLLEEGPAGEAALLVYVV
jgi:hypothetical protein